MRTVTEHGYTTYPRRFDAYKWFKPILVGLICGALTVILTLAVDFISKLIFGNADTSTGYDGMDFFTAGGAFSNSAMAVIPIPCLIIPTGSYSISD